MCFEFPIVWNLKMKKNYIGIEQRGSKKVKNI